MKDPVQFQKQEKSQPEPSSTGVRGEKLPSTDISTRKEKKSMPEKKLKQIKITNLIPRTGEAPKTMSTSTKEKPVHKKTSRKT